MNMHALVLVHTCAHVKTVIKSILYQAVTQWGGGGGGEEGFASVRDEHVLSIYYVCIIQIELRRRASAQLRAGGGTPPTRTQPLLLIIS